MLVASLRCERNRLSGSLPTEFFALSQLTSLVISNNTELSVDLEGIERLFNLQIFHAGHTQIQGTLPANLFADIAAMQTWSTHGTALSGTLPEELSLWNASLRILELTDNQLVGPLPVALEALTLLQELKLEGNGLSGTISAALCARRGSKFGELQELTVDCSVECSCCDFYEEKCG